MKKNLLLFFGLLLFTVLARAQYVDIPDDNFRGFLKSKYPTCFNVSDQMDTTCSLIVNELLLDVSAPDIINLDGIAYFKSLWLLICSNGKINSIPRLPDSLWNFDCGDNLLTSLPELPASLEYFDCKNNKLTQLPALPPALKSVICSNNKLTNLPGLPGNLALLECYNNDISCLPFLPNSLRNLQIDTTRITCLTNALHPDCLVFHPNNVRAYPQVCDNTNDLNNCKSNSSIITGRVFYDNNKNGIKDADEPNKADILVEITGAAGTYSAYTNPTGHYTLIANTPGEYSLFVPKIPALFTAMPAVTLLDLSNPTSVSQDIALQPTIVKDSLAVLSAQGLHVCDEHYEPIPFPPVVTISNYGYCRIAYQNAGTTALSTTLTITYDGSLIKIDSVSGEENAVINADNIVVTENNLAAGSSRFTDIYFSSTKQGPEQCLPNIQMMVTFAAGSTSASRPVFIESVGLLPVKLVSFTAMAKPGNIAALQWKTEAEENTRSFIVEQSTDGRNFKAITTVQAKGRGSSEYNFNTTIPHAAWVYFRLRITGVDNKFNYSKTIKLKGVDIKGGITILNNPVKNQLYIQTNTASLVNTVVRIINSQGIPVQNVILRQRVQNIDVSRLPAGIYYVQSGIDTKKIVIIK